MATDPNLIIEDPQQEMPLEAPQLVLPEVAQPEPEETDVAMLSSVGRMGKALKEAADEVPVPPKQDVPPVELIEGQIVINPIDPSKADEFRKILDVGPDTEIKIPMPNLRQMNLEDSQKQYVETLHRLWKEDISVARRHTRTMDQIVKDAQSIGWDEAAIQLLKRKKGEAYNDVEMARAIWVRLNAMNHLDDIMGDIASGGGKYDDADLLQFLPLAGSIEIQTSGAITEGGRAMAVLAHSGKIGALDTSRLSSVPEMLARYGTDKEGLDNFKAAYLSLPTQAHKARYMRTIWQKGLDVFAEAFVNSLLSSPVTHAVNIVGNTVFGFMQVPERALAGVIGSVRTTAQKGLTNLKAKNLVSKLSKKTDLTKQEKSQLTSARRFLSKEGMGTKIPVNIFTGLGGTERVQMTEAWSMLQSLGRGLEIGSKAAYKAAMKEEGSFGRGASKIDNRVDKAISSEYLNIENNGFAKAIDAYGMTVRALGSRMLLMEDEFAKGVLYRMELEALANRRMTELINNGMSQDDAVLEGARILAGHDATIVKGAEDFAVRTTFQGDLGKIARWAQGGFSHPLMKIFVPFFKTPMNIVSETLERTPVAGMTPAFWRDMRAGGASADIAMSKFILGSSAFALTAMYATGEVMPDFKITGMGPKDANARTAWKRSGLEPYSFAFKGNDGKWTSVQYGRLAPIAGILAMSSDYSEFSQYEDDEDTLTKLTIDAGASLYEQLKQLPMLQGVFEIAEVAGSEYESGHDKARRFGELITEKFAGALMTAMPGPTGSLTATIERGMNPGASNVDPTTEQTQNEFYTSPMARGWYKALNRAKSRSPFYSDEVPEKLNLWGQTMKQCENGGWCYISPIRVIDSKDNIVDKEMVNLGLGLRMPSKTQRGIKLTSDQYNEMILDMNLHDYGDGLDMIGEMEQLIDETYYIESDPGERLEFLRNIMNNRKEEVLDVIFAEGTELKAKEDYRKDMLSLGRKPLQ
tara:strand:+ start:1625 stop:4555 length:2931 start_codon:yes stop_codon:yes gene_type:complete